MHLSLLALLPTIAILCNTPLSAQVKSKSFNVVLKTLLNNNVPVITVPEAAKGFNSYLFLDSREEAEYNVSHILNARFVGYKSFTTSSLSSIDKKKPIVVYCSIGKRSENITKKLKEAGFVNVTNLYGGIFEWVNQGHPVFNNQNKKTENVHAYSRFWGQWVDKGIKVY
jgi:rhodanese-related sulfurtransferase